MTDIVHIVENAVRYGEFSVTAPRISIDKVPPAKQNIKDCTRRLACSKHDASVFRPIDSLTLQCMNPEHQFLMAFRAITGSLALCESVNDYLKSKNGARRQVFQWWAKRGIDAKTLSKQQGQEFAPVLEMVRRETAKWQKLYTMERREEHIDSVVNTFNPKVRIACSSIYLIQEERFAALTIVPEDEHATLVITAIRTNGQADTDLIDAGKNIIDMLENEPAQGIRHLIGHTQHFVANIDAFDNPQLITADERESIAMEMAAMLKS